MKLIAEIGINHNGDVETAKKLVDIAAFSGFDFVKFQKRNPDVCVPEDKKSEMRKTPWGDMTYLEYKDRLEFSHEEYTELWCHCKDSGIKMFASVWDMDSALFMREFTDIIKIPSPLITDHELLKYCRENYKTVIISTGMSTESEIEQAVDVGNPDVIMHTVSAYPCPIDELNLRYIIHLGMKYPKCLIGYSGHEWGLATTYAAAGMGASWIERHITLDHNMWGSDHKSSVDPVGMIKLVRSIRDIEKALGRCIAREVSNCEIEKREALRK